MAPGTDPNIGDTPLSIQPPRKKHLTPTGFSDGLLHTQCRCRGNTGKNIFAEGFGHFGVQWVEVSIVIPRTR